jgi:hypothetical protein
MRHRVVATITWDVESPTVEQGLEIVNKKINDFSINVPDSKITFRLDLLKDRVEKIKLGEFKIEEVIPFLTKEDIKKEYEYDGVKHLVKMSSQRYFIFRECMNCVACGLQGTRMLLECHPSDRSPHFNLYGEEDGKLILMTKDHIHPKAFGGEDCHSNYQTMCIICNNLKGHANLTLEGVKELRSIYDKNKNKSTKKQLNLLIEKSKLRLERPRVKMKNVFTKNNSDSMMSICDINLYKCGTDIVGKSVYETCNNMKHIGCIKKGTYLDPLIEVKETILFKFLDNEHFMADRSLFKNDFQ